MVYLVKKIRASLAVSQEELAKKLSTSPITVNRWENGKSKPNQMAQTKLYEVCVENGLELSDAIVASVTEKEIQDELILYHGSREGLDEPIRPISREECDFGQGFYMGTDPLQPMTLVCNKKAPVLYILKMDMRGLKCLHVDIGIEWAMLIAYFRDYMKDAVGTPIYQKYEKMAEGYDVIEGYIANDKMYRVLTDFFEMRITDTALIGSLSALKLGRQYVAVTQKACDQIRILKEKKMSKLELMILKDKSIVRRNEGIALADQIVMEHRRDGKYFDEILKEGSGS